MRRWLTLEPYRVPFYWGCIAALRVVLTIFARWRVQGRDNVPEGKLLVVSNHINNADPPVLAAGIRSRHVYFMAKEELFKGFFGFFVQMWEAFPVRRFDSDVRALLKAERHLRAGDVVGMFPEGTRSRTNDLKDFHPGTALIALRTGAPVLPCAITGTDGLRSPLDLFKQRRIRVRIGKPIPVERIKKPSEEQIQELTLRVQAAVAALLPPNYRETYTRLKGTGTDG